MNYILIGALLAIGWHFVESVYEIAYELLFSRLHKAKWYQVAAGKLPKETGKSKFKEVNNPIGFYHDKEES